MGSDLRAQAEQLVYRLYHDVPDDFTAWYATIESAFRTVEASATAAERRRLKPILDDMREASAAVDDAHGTLDYQARLVALALIARHYLRDLGADHAD